MAVTNESRQFHQDRREWPHTPRAPSVCDKPVNMSRHYTTVAI
jgi:hypothetical protein